MKKPSILHVVTVVIVLFALALSGCASGSRSEETHLKLALMPVLDVLPIYVAEQNGYFKDQNIQVETVPVKSPQERDVLMQTNQVDGVLTDLPSTALLNKDGPKVKAVYTARRPFPGAPLFRVLASPKSDLQSPADLKGVPVAVSQNTTIEYLTDRLLAGSGLAPDDIKVQEVTAITVRFEQLMNGNLKAAMLPDPMAQGAIAGGARLIVDDTKDPSLSQSVLTFRDQTLTDKPATVKKFLVAWEKAVLELNTNPDKYTDLMIQQGRVPDSIKGTYKMPPFPSQGIPSASETGDVINWMREKGLISQDMAYKDLVDAAYLPR
jgi:NitT/TauT family transport system substrate-binding protein